MPLRKKTLRRLPPVARSVAKDLATIELAARRLRGRVGILAGFEHDSQALLNGAKVRPRLTPHDDLLLADELAIENLLRGLIVLVPTFPKGALGDAFVKEMMTAFRTARRTKLLTETPKPSDAPLFEEQYPGAPGTVLVRRRIRGQK